jgi:hypothetical protein
VQGAASRQHVEKRPVESSNNLPPDASRGARRRQLKHQGFDVNETDTAGQAAGADSSVKKSPGSLMSAVRAMRRAVTTGSVDVPCGSCTMCCRDPAPRVDLQPHEVGRYPEAIWSEKNEWWELPRNDKGECVHLIDGRCSIRARRPFACRIYDCRVFILGSPPPDQSYVSFVERVMQMWDGWRLETPEDVDWLLATMRAIDEVVGGPTKKSFPDPRAMVTAINLRAAELLPEAARFRAEVGLATARAIARRNERIFRRDFLKMFNFVIPDAQAAE